MILTTIITWNLQLSSLISPVPPDFFKFLQETMEKDSEGLALQKFTFFLQKIKKVLD
jgi:hypothetical protein